MGCPFAQGRRGLAVCGGAGLRSIGDVFLFDNYHDISR